jgi:two-component system LytT family response regulator
MTAIRALVVDDEKPGRERLKRLLVSDLRVDLVACCGGGAEALARVRDSTAAGTPIDLMFLDVQMPELDGLAVAAQLGGQQETGTTPAVVFVTAHDEYAIRAFEAHAIDYLLKPFSDERFQASLDRVIRHIKAGHAHVLMSRMQALLGASGSGAPLGDPPGLAPRSKRPLDRIVVRGAHRVRLLPVDQISWIEADGPYVKLHTRDGGVHHHRGLLGSLDALLDNRRFVRIHRSAIVNIDLVDELKQDAHGDYVVLLRDRTEIRVGRHFRARLQARLGQQL